MGPAERHNVNVGAGLAHSSASPRQGSTAGGPGGGTLATCKLAHLSPHVGRIITRIDEARLHYDDDTGWSVTLHACSELRRTTVQDPIGTVVEFAFDTFSLARYLYDLTDEDWYINHYRDTLPADHPPFDVPPPSVMGWEVT